MKKEIEKIIVRKDFSSLPKDVKTQLLKDYSGTSQLEHKKLYFKFISLVLIIAVITTVAIINNDSAIFSFLSDLTSFLKF